ncbi:DNA repair protein rhp26 [Coemansia spiralis]|uniref:DNA repair protein rhp26 n=1 Tax=Coemansia spiralis TaxID=417178 RepID=A0A9W8GJ71_9FUNG|nr:DNA repair protein rhp26 [Coemansia spiralis]
MSLNRENLASNELQSLSELGVQVVDQLTLEQSVRAQATHDLNEREREAEHKRLVRAEIALDRKLEQLDKATESAQKAAVATTRHRNALAKVEKLEEEAGRLRNECAQIRRRIQEIGERAGGGSVGPVASVKQEPADVGESTATATANGELLAMLVPKRRAAMTAEGRRYGSDDIDADPSDIDIESDAYLPSDRHSRAPTRTGLPRSTKRKLTVTSDDSDASYHEEESTGAPGAASNISNEDDALLDDVATDDDVEALDRQTRLGIHTRESDTYDDGNEQVYQERVFAWCAARWKVRQAAGDIEPAASLDTDDSSTVDVDGQPVSKAQLAREPFRADPGATDYKIKAHEQSTPSLRVPRQIWDKLLEYQKAALRWMYTLHQQGAGGILGDEMGLGKTVQVAAFLASMYHSRLLNLPSVVVCPATLMRQWVREFHTWWPALRVVILHSTGHAIKQMSGYDGGSSDSSARDLSYDLMGNIDAKSRAGATRGSARVASPSIGAGDTGSAAGAGSGYDSADEYEYDAYGSRLRRKRKPKGFIDWRKKQPKPKKKQRPISEAARESLRRAEMLVDRVYKHGHIVVVTYSGLQVYRDVLLRRKWGYAVLDEGHMIRNPDAEATLSCKGLDTRHRILVTGTPIQNNLTELWSLFDYIFPGRLGTLPVFNNQFVIPITTGGYASANSLQVRAGYRCACILRDLIDPYLLRRLKADVAQDLPQKTEHVLFCRLTPMQRTAYIGFLRSNDMDRILSGRLQMLFGVDVARKICDHPDLLLLSTLPGAAITHREASGKDYGDWRKSGKLTIVRALLEMWRPHGHKVLIFSQTRQMLDIIERTIAAMPQMVYRRMDGSTPVQHRSAMVDEYNSDSSIFVFLLTTKVGGLGINLTGADRVILYSPDWNPSSDMQARERAWRLGQTRDVAIYRLMTAGTIEEKIYNRQIYKQLLSNKVLSDPNQKRFFHSQSLRDLFSLAGFDPNSALANSAGTGAGTRADGYTAQAMATDRRGGGDGRDSDLEETTETGRLFANARLFPIDNPADTSNNDSGDGIESIGGVVRLEAYKPPVDESDNTSSETNAGDIDAAARNTGEGAASEDRVLQSLFKMSGVHSAMKHDAIISGKDDESQAVEEEAERIASEARRVLRDSQRSRRELDVNVPTWTGMSGQAGMPGGSASGVAPPPNTTMRNDLPVEAKSGVSYALGKPLRAPAARASSSYAGDSAIYNPAMLARRSAADRRPPTSSHISSLSLSSGPRPPPASGKFGGHGGLGGTDLGALSSTSLLAGLKARSADMRAHSAATESGRGAELRGTNSHITRVQRDQIQHSSYGAPQSRGPGVVRSPAYARPHGAVSQGQRPSGDLNSQKLSAEDKAVVGQIRELLAENGGEISNALLVDRFRAVFSLSELPRLGELARRVADLESKQMGAQRTGIGRIVQKVWRLRAGANPT